MTEVGVAPPLVGDAVHVWCLGLDREPPGAASLPGEHGRAGRMRDGVAARRFLVSRVRLRVVLASYLGIDADDVRFAVAERGKPSIVDGGDLEFSLSRSAGVGLVAVTRGRPVGVDVEEIRSDHDHGRLAERFFTPGEAEALRQEPDGDRRCSSFFTFWARKEAVLKASGAGLGDGLGLDVRAELVASRWSVASLDAHPGFAAAVATEGALEDVALYGRDLAPSPRAGVVVR